MELQQRPASLVEGKENQQMQPPMRMNFILIPGAWMGAWAWEPVTRGLRALGHHVHPVTLSGLSKDADSADVGLATHAADGLPILEAGRLRDEPVVRHLHPGTLSPTLTSPPPL